MADDTDTPQVALRVVRGHATDDEIAALTVLTAVLSSGAQDAGSPSRGSRGGWSDPRRSLNPGAPRGWAR